MGAHQCQAKDQTRSVTTEGFSLDGNFPSHKESAIQRTQGYKSTEEAVFLLGAVESCIENI